MKRSCGSQLQCVQFHTPFRLKPRDLEILQTAAQLSKQLLRVSFGIDRPEVDLSSEGDPQSMDIHE